MELSLEFLKARIEMENPQVPVRLVGDGGGCMFRGVQMLLAGTTPEAGMIYVCAAGAGQLERLYEQQASFPAEAAFVLGCDAAATETADLPDSASSLEGGAAANVAVEADAPFLPGDVAGLHFPTLDSGEAFNLIIGVFLYFGDWQERVYRRALEQPGLDEFMSLLNEVTPNPWYIADGSYRVLTARNAPEVEDISYIWRFLYRNRRLPLETILAMEDMGKIEQMSRMKRAYIPTVEPFNIPFVSKSIDTSEGAVAHFYIIGVYTRLSQYEIEIAEFFGNVLNMALARGESRLPAAGRFYDSFLSSLIAGEPPESSRDILQKMLFDLGWDISDQLRLVVFGDSKESESVSNRQRLLTLESRCSARGFFHEGRAAAVINVTRFDHGGLTGALAMLLRSLARDFRCSIGVSESFGGFESIMSLRKWYDQALFCLETTENELPADEHGGGGPQPVVVTFPSVAVGYFQKKIAQVDGMAAFVHPALAVLRSYDEEHRTNLLETLRVYLENDRNVTLTAERLFVHRNTLLKRVNKIVALTSSTSLDLDDAECRKRLLVSFLVG